ncbi:MAG: LytTR family DNA-binding domain-containing protein [Syntrophomonadaceae bacterium]|nr:LytTR family DNA-binding domain-containing protein [Syntrophomonadaceae bacterium]MDD3023763.1 LytTR family DNA-binding domain-containing protein [Syntrophomonadaceae bacterium]
MTVKLLIVDDDERERIVLRYLLEQIGDIQIVGEAVHGLEALLLCQERRVDLVCLDIAMPEMGGLETAAKLKELKNPPFFAFITARPDMAVKAFEMGALDFIVKPVEQSRIKKTIDKAKLQIAHRDVIEDMVSQHLKARIDLILERCKDSELYSGKLFIREKGKISFVNQTDIIFCESQGKKVLICTDKQDYVSNYTLNSLEKRLDERLFFRAHQAFIVNIDYIREVINLGEGSYIMHLENCQKDIILSRSKAKLLKDKMGMY